MTEPSIEIENDASQSAYVIYVDGTAAGRAEYVLRDERTVFTHTEVDQQHSGLGLASKLVRFALDDVRSHGGSLVPMCPFVAGYIRRHPEYEDLVDGEMAMRLKAKRNHDGE